MYHCNICDFFTTTNYNLKRHNISVKHLKKVNDLATKDKYFCEFCDKMYSHQSSLSRHRKLCELKVQIPIFINTKNQYYGNNSYQSIKNQLELQRIKFENVLLKRELNKKNRSKDIKFENELLKKELNKKDLEKELAIKDVENKNLKMYNNCNNVINNNTIINNNVKISKIQYLNSNFGNVIDINTFIENYKTKHGLTNEQCQILLENYQNDGINSCISSLVHYLKKSAVEQYKELKGKDISIDNIILPFLLSDKSLREHFEKSINGKWDKTTMVENIKKIITITNDQIFKYHKQFIGLNGSQKKRLINGILKASAYSVLSQISPDLYKIEDSSEVDLNQENNNLLECSKDILNDEEDEDELEEDDDDELDDEEDDDEEEDDDCEDELDEEEDDDCEEEDEEENGEE